MSQVLQAPPAVEHDDIVALHASWADYQRMLEIRGEQAAPRLAFRRGVLQIMSPSRPHERIKGTIGRLIEQWCLHHDIEFSTVGSWTLEDEEAESAVEPDECYIFGADDERARPHLAIEVVWSHWKIDKIDIYAKLGVAELWIWREGAIEVLVLDGGEYRRAEGSAALTGFPVAIAAGLVHERTSQAIRAFQQHLHEVARVE